jgi:ubiquinone/menaquinone biosynthesis C-methylase UbiE
MPRLERFLHLRSKLERSEGINLIMSQAAQKSSGYVMGYDDRERNRLSLQGSILAPLTRQLFQRAGLAPGMRVLDIGCGVGEVAFLAAELVATEGRVTAIDVDEHALEIGRAHAKSRGFNNITFVQGDIHTFRSDAPFDAAVGRHILVHVKEPLKTLQHVFSVLRSGGVAAFHETHGTYHPPFPGMPLLDKLTPLAQKFFAQNVNNDIGPRLYELFKKAGFLAPHCRLESETFGGPDAPVYAWYAETFKSILPQLEAAGQITAAEAQIDTLAQRLKEEAVANGSGLPFHPMVAAFARKP